MPRLQTSFLFDLDGTLVDSVYEHVLAWRDALDEEGIDLSVWRIHRKIGMSGGLFTNMLLRETGLDISEERVNRLRQAACRGVSQARAQDPAAAGREGAAGLSDAKRISPGPSPPAAGWKPRARCSRIWESISTRCRSSRATR